MDCWNILGISPDADMGAIKRAYAAKLKRSRPEDDAEAFNELRCAYEQAVEQTQLAQANSDSVLKDDIETGGQELVSRFAAVEIEALQRWVCWYFWCLQAGYVFSYLARGRLQESDSPSA